MGFFDNLIVEEETSTATATATFGGSQGGAKKDDDSDLIIIDDSVSDITSEDVPDTVNSIFSEDKVEEITESKTSDEDIVIQDEIEPSIEIENKTEDSLIISDNTETEEIVEKTADISDNSTSSDFLNFNSNEVVEEAVVTTKSKEDPNEILGDAVSKFEALLKTHADIRNGKMKEIEEINKQIASLKDSAKALTAEVKEIGVEEDKVSKMIELFKSQKV
ncbi:hypothetical protein M0P65_00555 [Candidatus Gracilibacteria bacterium]|nr:hypothetical protein [Candidatus Gracilibacteria bacterium]